MTAFPVTPPGRLRHLIYFSALTATAVCIAWLVGIHVMAAASGELEPLRAAQGGLMALAIPFAPSVFLLAVACWLSLSRRPAPAIFQVLAVANAAWSLLLASALVSL